MKLIIDIPIDRYKQIQNEQWLPNRLGIEKAIANGIPLEQIRTEIESIEDFEVVNGALYVREYDVMQIIDKFTKGESE